jgi:hypothetical protein
MYAGMFVCGRLFQAILAATGKAGVYPLHLRYFTQAGYGLTKILKKLVIDKQPILF